MHVFNFKAFRVLVDSHQETHKKLAKKFDVSEATINNWKNGSAPSTSNIASIADYYNIHIRDLLMSPVDFKFTEEEITAATEEGDEDKSENKKD